MWELLAIVKNLALIWNELGSHWVVLSKAMTWSVLNFTSNVSASLLRKDCAGVKVEEGTPARRVM